MKSFSRCHRHHHRKESPFVEVDADVEEIFFDLLLPPQVIPEEAVEYFGVEIHRILNLPQPYEVDPFYVPTWNEDEEVDIEEFFENLAPDTFDFDLWDLPVEYVGVG
ncbi:hypothetical protein A2U01_0067899, partial [Trifolium medium]|nr:hypothetical protein [Trifolium medium]